VGDLKASAMADRDQPGSMILVLVLLSLVVVSCASTEDVDPLYRSFIIMIHTGVD
jgi:hypothetical protein